MMFSDRRDDAPHNGGPNSDSARALNGVVSSLAEQGVDLTGSESPADLALMNRAVEEFRHAADLLGGRAMPPVAADDRARHVVPPRADDETPRQYAERIERIAERFRALARQPGRTRRQR
jgi:hypothetical protein